MDTQKLLQELTNSDNSSSAIAAIKKFMDELYSIKEESEYYKIPALYSTAVQLETMGLNAKPVKSACHAFTAGIANSKIPATCSAEVSQLIGSMNLLLVADNERRISF